MKKGFSPILNLKIDLFPKQKELFNKGFNNNEKRYLNLYGSSRGGKTFANCYDDILRCLTFPGANILIIRKELSSLKKGVITQTFPLIFKLISQANNVSDITQIKINNSLFVKFNGHDGIMTFYNGSKIYFTGGNDSEGSGVKSSLEKLLSTEFFKITIEEASEVGNDLFETLLTRLSQNVFHFSSGEKGVNKIVTTLNPTTKGHFTYSRFFEGINPSSGESLADFEKYENFFFHVSDNESIGEDYITSLKTSSPSFRTRFYEGSYSDGFEGEVFKRINWLDISDKCIFDRVVIYVDPSYKSGPKNDYKAVVIVAMAAGCFYVLDVQAEKTTTYNMVQMIHYAQRFVRAKFAKNNFETVIENKGLADDFELMHAEFCSKNKTYVPYVFDRHEKGDKYMRIETLLYPLNENNKLFFSEEIRDGKYRNLVENQMLNFKKNLSANIHDDIPDAIHGAINWISFTKERKISSQDYSGHKIISNHLNH